MGFLLADLRRSGGAQIMARLNLHDVPSLVLYAVRQGLISPDD
ncbi:hypothetical protein N7301_18035 [Stutzerimonas stutzeri]|jgi:hypothetical protein|nr:hypothetical protein [Stutzerimonas stutzeri]MDH0059456.1 hypothetical protein [Stutzerimonas stutzeri]